MNHDAIVHSVLSVINIKPSCLSSNLAVLLPSSTPVTSPLAGPLSGRQPRLLCCDWFQPALALGLRAELRQVLQQMLQPQPQQQQQQQLAEQQQPAPIESTFQEDSAEAEVIEIEDDSE
jgi:hypothetical protein